MQVIENASIVGRSMGEKNVVIVENENTGRSITLMNPEGIEVELGIECRVMFDSVKMNLVSFEPVMEEELV
jgi:hypothetical protein